MEIISKEQAALLNKKWYFTGKTCKNGHTDRRYVNTGICYSCKTKNIALDYSRHKQRIITCNNKSYIKNKDARKETNKKWTQNNQEKVREIKIKNKIKHHEKYKERARLYQREKRKYSLFRVNSAISKQIWAFMKGKKGGRKWEKLVGYSFDLLREKLEGKFYGGMNWDNYGTLWEIDHNKPKSWFKNEESDELIKEIWALENLQPMYITKNRSKGNKYEGTMQSKEYVSNALKTESADFEAISNRINEPMIRLIHAFMGLSSESGEAIDMLKKHIFYGKQFDRTNAIEEMGDCFWFLAIACDVLGVSFEEVMEKNIAKLKARYGDKFTESAALERNLEKERAILEG